MNRKTFISTLLAIPAAILGIKATKPKNPWVANLEGVTPDYNFADGGLVPPSGYFAIIEWKDGKRELFNGVVTVEGKDFDFTFDK